MSSVKITKIFRKDVETRFGIKPKVGIMTEEHGEKWLSTFKTKGTEDWVEGMTVEVEVSEKGGFLNFNPVVKGGATANVTPALEARVKKLEDAVFGTGALTASKPAQFAAEDEVLDNEF